MNVKKCHDKLSPLRHRFTSRLITKGEFQFAFVMKQKILCRFMRVAS